MINEKHDRLQNWHILFSGGAYNNVGGVAQVGYGGAPGPYGMPGQMPSYQGYSM